MLIGLENHFNGGAVERFLLWFSSLKTRPVFSCGLLLFTYFFIAYLICLYAYLCNRWYSCLVALLNHVHATLIDRLTLIDLVTVWIQLNPAARFQFHVFTFFFFFLHVNSNLTWVHCAGEINHYSRTVHHYSRTKKY